MEKILVVEDEAQISRFLMLELTHEGYEVEVCSDGRTGYEKASEEQYDLLLLDVMLPNLSGIELCRRIRRSSDVPVILLTAKDDISDKVTGLDSGADDYVTKPFAIEELLARIRSALKRRRMNEGVHENGKSTSNKLHPLSTKDSFKEKKLPDHIRIGELVLSKLQHRVTFGEEEIPLSKREYDLLLYLMENRNIVISREQLIEKVWGYDFYGDTNVTDVYIRYLRSKIDNRFGVSFVKTVRGVGYMFEGKES